MFSSFNYRTWVWNVATLKYLGVTWGAGMYPTNNNRLFKIWKFHLIRRNGNHALVWLPGAFIETPLCYYPSIRNLLTR